MSYQAEYIWIDGTEPSPLLRSKTRIVADGKEPGSGASTVRAPIRPPGTTRTVCCGRSSAAPIPCADRTTSW